MDQTQRAVGEGAVTGMPRLLLRLEGFTVLVVALLVYLWNGGDWWFFVLMLLVPDLSMAGYLAGPRIGAGLYNAAHTYLVPAALSGAGLVLDLPPLTFLAVVWLAHIGLDRALGFGLKYGTGFADTHLGRLSGGARRASSERSAD